MFYLLCFIMVLLLAIIITIIVTYKKISDVDELKTEVLLLKISFGLSIVSAAFATYGMWETRYER